MLEGELVIVGCKEGCPLGDVDTVGFVEGWLDGIKLG